LPLVSSSLLQGLQGTFTL